MQHPARVMLLTWSVCVAGFLILPFQLQNRVVTFWGFLILAMFLLVFCAGSLLASSPMEQRPRRMDIMPDFRMTDRILGTFCMIAVGALMIELSRRNFLDLAASYAERSDRANAVLYGQESSSSLWFQLGFLTYPAGFAYLARQLIFEPKPVLWKLGLFGIAPPLAASLAAGGRSPLFYGLMVFFLALGLRKQWSGRSRQRRDTSGSNFVLFLILGVVGLVALNYFAKVFIVRAETSGGIAGAYDNAALNWGVTFEGYLAPFLNSVLGEGNTFLLFLFAWYFVQGLVMSNIIFTQYTGPMDFGVYGIDLATAVMRRVDGPWVADRFLRLLDINTYGFLPSAFGSIYVDFAVIGFLFIGVWGYLAGLVYRRVKEGNDPRWLIFVPYLTIGIIFSVINTPLGFSNGLSAHIWVLVAFFSTRVVRRVPRAAPPPVTPQPATA
jgi:oligosaccharide repeat unit polymerase